MYVLAALSLSVRILNCTCVLRQLTTYLFGTNNQTGLRSEYLKICGWSQRARTSTIGQLLPELQVISRKARSDPFEISGFKTCILSQKAEIPQRGVHPRELTAQTQQQVLKHRSVLATADRWKRRAPTASIEDLPLLSLGVLGTRLAAVRLAAVDLFVLIEIVGPLVGPRLAPQGLAPNGREIGRP